MVFSGIFLYPLVYWTGFQNLTGNLVKTDPKNKDFDFRHVPEKRTSLISTCIKQSLFQYKVELLCILFSFQN